MKDVEERSGCCDADVDTKLTRLLEILSHEHTDKCFREYPEDCGEHHAHNKACLIRRAITCTFTGGYRELVFGRAAPALVALVKATRTTADHCARCGGQPGGRGLIPGQRVPPEGSPAPWVTCPGCGGVRAALSQLAQTDIRW